MSRVPSRPLSAPALLYRQVLLAKGYTRSAIRHQLDIGTWTRIADGVYLDTTADEADRQQAIKIAWLNRAGPEAAFSHHTAAAFHGFDSTRGWTASPIVLSHTMQHRLPKTPGYEFVRSRSLHEPHSISDEGLRFTSRIRTLIDVLAHVDLIEGERVLESALRGSEPKRPDLWRTNDLLELHQFIAHHPRQPGVRQARLLLAQRPIGSRPTGSIAATAAVQALRHAGLTDVVCEALVVAPDEHGNPRRHFLDLFLVSQSFDIEVDGNAHTEPRRRAEDLKRDRRLAKAIGVLRFTAHEALHEPDRVVAEVREEISRRRQEVRSGGQSHQLVGSGLSWQIVPTAQAA
jgi:Protein of unknown function (DUF559)